MDRQDYPCQEQCKYQRQGRCVLEKAGVLTRVHGATCCEHLLEDEEILHR